MNYMAIILVPIILFILFIVVLLVSKYLSNKRLEEIVSELGLVQGEQYTVITNNGNRYLNLTYDRISYGNKSQNGSINIYFFRDSKYRGIITQKEVMIKYGNIWQISPSNASMGGNAEYPNDSNSILG